MDPKSINNLDPKMRETYERVMGSPPNPQQPSPSGALTSPALSGLDNKDDTSGSNTFASAASPFTSAYTPADSQALQNADSISSQQNKYFDPSPTSAQANQQIETGGSSNSLVKIVYVVSAIVFLILYTFVWIKIFNVQIP